MKKLTLGMTLVAMAFCIGCKKDKDEKDQNSGTQYDNTPVELTVSDMHYTECLNHVDPDPDKEKPADWDSVYINYFDNSMQVNIHNFCVGCNTTNIEAISEMVDDTIFISYIIHSDPLRPSCHCLVDTDCKISGIPHGLYHIILCDGFPRYHLYFHTERHQF